MAKPCPICHPPTSGQARGRLCARHRRRPGPPRQLQDGRRMTMRLGTDTRAALDRLARERGKGVAEAVRWLVERWEEGELP